MCGELLAKYSGVEYEFNLVGAHKKGKANNSQENAGSQLHRLASICLIYIFAPTMLTLTMLARLHQLWNQQGGVGVLVDGI